MLLKRIPQSLHQLRQSSSISQYMLFKAFPNVFARPLKKRMNVGVLNPSIRRINRLIGTMNRRYLEIGVSYGHTIEGVQTSERWGVDPFPNFNTDVKLEDTYFFEQTSDEFFSKLTPGLTFDGIFVDGLHQIEQVKRDILNCLAHLEGGGFILVDDVVPKDEISSIGDRDASIALRRQQNDSSTTWHGDCFKILPFVVENFDFMEWNLIIAPDNPQLLLYFRNFKKPNNLTDLIAKLKNRQITELSYHEAFNRDWMSCYNIGIEEIVISDFIRKRQKFVSSLSNDSRD